MKASARSVGMNLARPLKAGNDQRSVRVASRRLNLELESIVALRRARAIGLSPGVETPG
jgi:hypothetical protein